MEKLNNVINKMNEDIEKLKQATKETNNKPKMVIV